MHDQPHARTFSDALDSYRRRAGLSQNRLAHAAGLDPSYVSRLLTGDRSPRRMTVAAFAGALMLSDEDRVVLFESAGFVAMPSGRRAEQPRATDREGSGNS